MADNVGSAPVEAPAAGRGITALARRRPLSLRVAIGVLVLVLSVIGLWVSQRVPPVKAAPIGARLELAAGEVTLAHDGRRGSVVSGVPVPVGAALTTGKGARALVRLSDGSTVFLRGGSEVTLGAEGLALKEGEVWLDAPPSDRGGLSHALGDVTVSAADAGLSLRRAGAEVAVYVTRGLAVVTSPGGRVEVSAGEEAKVAGSGAPNVAPVAFWEDWTGGMGDHRALGGEAAGSGRIYGVALGAVPGAQARTLEISRQVVRAVVRDGIAETEVDQTFGNPGGSQVEGWYWFTVPERAIVSSFSVETDGVLVEGEVIEKKEAAARYAAAAQSGHEPALLEWVDGRSYRARIYPVPASGSRRVVLRYLELLPTQAGKLVYVYPMRAPEAAPIGELALSVDLGDAGRGAHIATLADAVVEDGGRRVSMRRSGYAPRADFQLEVSAERRPAPLRVGRFAAGEDRADYVMARYTPDVDWTEIKELPADVVLVVDTSASADEPSRQQKAAAAEAILRAMSAADHFALIALDAAPAVLHPKEGLAEASEKEIAAALTRLAEHATGGATDLGAMYDAALGRVHGKDQPALIYIGDGLATSGEVSGERLAERLRRSLTASRARFFTVGVGAEANHGLLRELSREGGGQHFRIDEAEAAMSEVLRLVSAIKTPTITDLAIDLGAGLDEPMLSSSGKVSRGEEVVLLARTHHALPPRATVRGRLAGKEITREYAIELDRGVGTALVPRLWAAEKIRRLLGEGSSPDAQRGKIVELGLEYGLVTPFTSTLALESELAYRQQGIQRRRSPLRGVKLTALTPGEERAIEASLAPFSPAVAVGCSKGESAPAASMRERDMEDQSIAVQAPAAQAPAVPGPAATAAPATEAYGGLGADKASDMDRQLNQPAQPTGRNRGAGQAPEEIAQAAPAPPPEPAPPMDSLAPRPGARLPSGDARPAPASGGGGKKTAPLSRLKSGDLEDPWAQAKQGQDAAADGKERREAAKIPPRPRPVIAASPCSDVARRPLADRIVVWSKRLGRTTSADELIARYEGARATCELPDWRSRSALLGLLQDRVRTEGAAEALLAHFAAEPEAKRYLAQAILRRSVEPAIAAVVRRALFDPRMSWAALDEELAALGTPEEKLARLRQALLEHPDDPEGEIRRVQLLARAGQKDEALAYGRRLRDRGLMSPALSLTLGDLFAASGFEGDAIRTYSEIVEFDPASAASRRLLGDVYLRHGWYPAAYRQYATLSELAPDDPSAWLRLAAAAAGSGRVDEALRLQRKVAGAEGTPGPSDPRAWARLLSAARLGRLLADPANAAQAEGLSRKLKELQLFSGPAALRILAWEDYAAAISLVTLEGDAEAPIGDTTQAPQVGLASVLLPAPDLERLRWVVRWKDDPPGRDVRFEVTTLIWDGASFKVSSKPGVLAAAQREIGL